MAEFVRQHVADRVATVTLDRPDVHNAFNEAVIKELTDAFLDLGDRGEVRAIILAADGRSFCAGADIHWMKRMVDYSMEENIADATSMADMLLAIRMCPRPVIARVHGAAIGGGVGLVAACDMAVAVRSAVFCLSEVRLGIIPAVISPYVLEKIGPAAARRYALTAERFAAAEARRIGLVAEIADHAADLDPIIDRLCRHLADNGPEALAHCKRLFSDGVGIDWKQATERTTRLIAERRVSPEGQEGLRAFLEKRPPAWQSMKKND